jgi:ElaA protein
VPDTGRSELTGATYPQVCLDPGVDLTWRDLHHGELTTAELHDVLALRNRVFVVEQECAYQDVDGLDLVGGTRHLLAVRGEALVGYARILAPAASGPARIGRVVVTDAVRGQRVGRRLMERALDSCGRHWPGRDVLVSAQAHLERFYRSLGFVPVSEVYDEDGIPHVDMLRTAG